MVLDFDPQKDREWRAQDEWYMKDFSPREGIDYTSVGEYANTLRKEIAEIHAILDSKAEWLFGLGLLSIGAVGAAVSQWHLAWEYFCPTLALIVVSMGFAMVARLPRTSLMPFTIRAAIERAEADPKHFAAWMAASTHVAVTGAVSACKKKSRLIVISAWILLAAAALIVVPLSHGPAVSQSLQATVSNQAGNLSE